jgi:glycosyltransferase involved in cell wall biosynthesis
MRILLVINSLGASGAEHSTAALLPHLRCRGHEVEVATLYDAGFGDEEAIRRQGFVVRPLRSRHFVGRVAELRRRIQAFRPDVVHTALFDSDLVGRTAALGTAACVVSSFVNTPYEPARLTDPGVRRWRLRLVQAVDMLTARVAVDGFHAVSSGVADSNAKALRLDRSRITVVERGRSSEALGVPTSERRARVRTDLGVSADVHIVLAVGRQEHQKNHIGLIDAVDELLERASDQRFVVLVAGREGNATQSVTQHLRGHPRAADAITFLGHRHDVPDLLCAADVLAISSTYEGTAGVALEAMALRCPIVCTDLAGLRGILVDRVNAVLVPPNSPVAFAEGLLDVLNCSELAETLRANGRRDFDQRFTIERACAAMELMYGQVRARRRGAT